MLYKKFFYYRTISPQDKEADSPLQIGTLRYAMPGLLTTIAYLCIGTMMFTMMSTLFSSAIPLVMKNLNSSNQFIALMLTTIPYILNMLITPAVSFKSDRLRSRFGRRMPFLLFATPFAALFLIGCGWSEMIAKILMETFPFLPASFPLWLLGFLIIGYQFFFLILGSLIHCVFPDVIPEKFFGRFMSIYMISGSAISFLFSRYLLGFIESQLELFFTLTGVAFLILMLGMILLVREGEYPPPDDDEQGPPSILRSIKIYVKECYSIPFYYSFFLMMSLSDVSIVCRNMFNLLYAKETLQISVWDYGKMIGYGGLIGVFLSYPIGLLIDRFHALKVYASALILVIGVNIWSFFYVCDYKTFYISTIALAVVYTVQTTSTLPVFVAILPKERFGQFCSANALLRALIMAVAGYGGGMLFDYLQNYQYIFAWDFLFTTMAFLCFLKLYSDWNKAGRKSSYHAPLHNQETTKI